MEHFLNASRELDFSHWDDASSKSGKFIEAALKALWVHVGETPPAGKQFKVGSIIDSLAGKSSFADTVRLTIPRACRFAYEVASNRGARHDPDEIDANEMDARAVFAVCIWILAEMVRYSQRGVDLDEAKAAVESLLRKRYPFGEEIDGRVYADVGESAPEKALVILYLIYPKRMSRADLTAALQRHEITKHNAEVAIARIARFVDDDGEGQLRLRNPGVLAAEQIISRGQAR